MQKRVLVTGASEGIGRVFALRLAREGYQVTAVARNETRLKELVQEMQNLKPMGHAWLSADLSTPEGVWKISGALRGGAFDLLVNNAGFGVYGKFYELPLERLQEMTRLNCDALVALSHVFVKDAMPGSALINVSSVLAFLPMPNNGLYSATKAFVTSFTESLWAEQAPRGIFVLGLCPGATVSLFNERAGVTRVPTALLQRPEQVVEVAMKALRRRRSPTVISGLHNRIFTLVARLLPRKWVVRMMSVSA